MTLETYVQETKFLRVAIITGDKGDYHAQFLYDGLEKQKGTMVQPRIPRIITKGKWRSECVEFGVDVLREPGDGAPKGGFPVGHYVFTAEEDGSESICFIPHDRSQVWDWQLSELQAGESIENQDPDADEAVYALKGSGKLDNGTEVAEGVLVNIPSGKSVKFTADEDCWFCYLRRVE